MDPLQQYLDSLHHTKDDQELDSWLNADFSQGSPDMQRQESISTPPALEMFSHSPLFPSMPSPDDSTLANTMPSLQHPAPTVADQLALATLISNPSIANLLATISAPRYSNHHIDNSDHDNTGSPSSSSNGTPSTKVFKSFEEKTPDEQEKRRRNTLASARFRQKKKLKEQALERTAKDMTQRAEMMEQKIKEYEMEIKWLRSVVTERDGAKKLNDLYTESGLVFQPHILAAGAEGVQTPITQSTIPFLQGLAQLSAIQQQQLMQQTFIAAAPEDGSRSAKRAKTSSGSVAWKA
ncbi:hypothetical protein SmJEL517_g00225 [Synchytrium microbalum]|uniref:BZIP domain-containing protein n=1 Tax=Synchytrium microbalum TaxID=1806994 RepID=A0A507CG79_9FUNG|nr:uncharacterized protein SmJEL517_g00225 [Synchytrium microbalum]TPX38199.1 hypothetical protein SmJEL517_g00225 [Synchytrium microbalum]